MLTPLETACLAAFRASKTAPRYGDTADAWTAFGLSMQLEASRMLREVQDASARGEVERKGDGSPATAVERELELLLQTRLAEFLPEVAMVGEETGGSLPPTGYAAAIDPVDGTWAFLTDTGTYASTLAVFRDGVPIHGFIANPATGEIGYASAGGASRVIRLSLFEDPDTSHELPVTGSTVDKILVNVHPSPVGARAVAALYAAWGERRIRSVRSPGGSPSWAIVEAAKGHYAYVNLWSKRPAEPFDLAAAALIVRGAGGDIVGLDDQPVDAATHAGPFVVAVRAPVRRALLEVVRGAIGESEAAEPIVP